jgi:Flp pilus assembly protein TadG
MRNFVLRNGRPFRRGERGQALVLFAAGLAAFLGIVGLSVDIGLLVYTRTDLQKAADAAALAGSQDLPNAATATSSANIYVGLNSKSATTAAVAITTTSSANDTIQVTATRHIDYFFLKVLGLSGTDVSATAKSKRTVVNITGYAWSATAPVVIWGGSQQNPVAADAGCPLHTCVGKSYTFLDSNWFTASGKPSEPGWNTENQAKSFKGDLNHGAGSPVNEIGDVITNGGIGDYTPPPPGTIIVVPVMDTARGTSASDLHLHIAAWVILRVDAGCTKTGCKGTVLSPATTTPPDGYDNNGSVQPPPGLVYGATTTSLTQ